MNKLLIILLFITPYFLLSQTILQTVDFETNGAGYTVSPTETNANTSDPDYWIRTNGTTPVIYASEAFTGCQGSYFFTGEDLDYDTGTTKHYVTCDAINVSGYESFQIKLLLAGCGSGYDKEGEEFLKIQYQFDSGGFTTLAQFLGNGNYYTEDANADGTVDGSDINPAMQEFTYSIPGSGSSLQIRIWMYNGGSEELAIDYIRVSGTESSLPVKLDAFTASSNGNSVDLNWTTASEKDNLGFIIDRKANDGTWQQLASYQTHSELAGKGTTSSPSQYAFIDNTISAGADYDYRLSEVNINGEKSEIGTTSVVAAIPSTTQLLAAYPNPFNPSTMLNYNLAKDSHVTLTVYDVLGRQIKLLSNQHQSAGQYSIQWDGTTDAGIAAPSGTYLVRMQTGNTSQVQKVLFIK